jgi:hypothetical protein
MQTQIDVSTTSDRRGPAEAHRKARYRILKQVQAAFAAQGLPAECPLWETFFRVAPNGRTYAVLRVEGDDYFDAFSDAEGSVQPFGSFEQGLARCFATVQGGYRPTGRYPRLRYFRSKLGGVA